MRLIILLIEYSWVLIMNKHNKITNIFDYVGYIAKVYSLIQKDSYSVYQCKVINILQTKAKHFVIRVQVSGKNSTFTSYPEDIMNQDNFIDCFSQDDIQTMTKLALVNTKHNQPLSYLSRCLDKRTAKAVFVYENEFGSLSTEPAENDVTDNHFIHQECNIIDNNTSLIPTEEDIIKIFQQLENVRK